MLHGGEIYNIQEKIEYDFSVNLNPIPCPERIIESLFKAVSESGKYPDLYQKKFREKIAEYENKKIENYGYSIDYRYVIGGNGASELLSAMIRMINPKRALVPVPSFYGYRHALNMCSECEFVGYKLSEGSEFLIEDDFIQKITKDIDVIILANPNNPTGRLIPENILGKIVNRCMETGTRLIVDECFKELSEGDVQTTAYLFKYPDIFIVNAFTKLFSIPGVRVGYMIATPSNIELFRKYLPEWNLSVFAQKAGIAGAEILGKGDFIERTSKIIKEERTYITKELRALGFKVYESDTSFILFHSKQNIFNELKKRGILIRDCSNFEGLCEGHYRISVKDHESNRVIISALKAL